MFRVKMLFSTVSISDSKYCFNIFTLPGNWAMLENKLHIWSLSGGCWAQPPRAEREQVGRLKRERGDDGWLFALLYIVKKERIMYIEILFWIKNSVYNDKKFC